MSLVQFPWQTIETVLLDMDGTLLDLHFDNHFWMEHVPQAYAKYHGITVEQTLEKLMPQFVALKGTLNWYCLDHWTELTGLPIAALKRETQHKITFRSHAKAFLQALQKAGKRTLIVTNAHRDSVQLKMECTGLDRLVDGVISSHDYGYPKEHNEFWQQLSDQESVDVSRALFVDDSEPVLIAAEQFGVAHILRILAPDSQQPATTCERFLAVNDFNELDLLNDSA